jgi:hypothetical protein
MAGRNHVLRRLAQGIDDQSNRMAKGNLKHCAAGFMVIRLRPLAMGCRPIDPYIGFRQDLRSEFLVRLRNPLEQVIVPDVLFPCSGQLLREQQVDAVRLALHVRVNPTELDLDLFGQAVCQAQDTKPTGPSHSGDNVAAMAEREERELDTK